MSDILILYLKMHLCVSDGINSCCCIQYILNYIVLVLHYIWLTGVHFEAIFLDMMARCLLNSSRCQGVHVSPCYFLVAILTSIMWKLVITWNVLAWVNECPHHPPLTPWLPELRSYAAPTNKPPSSENFDWSGTSILNGPFTPHFMNDSNMTEDSSQSKREVCLKLLIYCVCMWVWLW